MAAKVSRFMQVRDLPLALLWRLPIPEILATAGDSGGNGAKTPATAGNSEISATAEKTDGKDANISATAEKNAGIVQPFLPGPAC